MPGGAPANNEKYVFPSPPVGGEEVFRVIF